MASDDNELTADELAEVRTMLSYKAKIIQALKDNGRLTVEQYVDLVIETVCQAETIDMIEAAMLEDMFKR